MPEEIEDIIEDLEDAKCEVNMIYQKHLGELERLRESYPLGFEKIFEELRKRIETERDSTIDALDMLISDYQKK